MGYGRGDEEVVEVLRLWSRIPRRLRLALGWAMWKTYLGRAEWDSVRRDAMGGCLGVALRVSARPEEALPMLEAELALTLLYYSHDEEAILTSQSNLASCFSDLGRHDEALVLKRAVYARKAALLGVSHKNTILSGVCLVATLKNLDLWDEVTELRDQLLPAARRSLGDDHDLTLRLRQNLAATLQLKPGRTRHDPRLIHTDQRAVLMFDLNTGDDLLEAETIMQDVARRRRRVFGPVHPQTLHAEAHLFKLQSARRNREGPGDKHV